MILTIAIIIALFTSLLYGDRRGFVNGFLTIIILGGALWVAINFTHPLTGLLTTVFSSRWFLNGVVFAVLFMVSVYLLNRIARVFRIASQLPILRQINGLAGALVSFICGYLITYLLLVWLVQSGQTWFTHQYVQSGLAQTIVDQTPLVTYPTVSDWLNS